MVPSSCGYRIERNGRFLS